MPENCFFDAQISIKKLTPKNETQKKCLLLLFFSSPHQTMHSCPKRDCLKYWYFSNKQDTETHKTGKIRETIKRFVATRKHLFVKRKDQSLPVPKTLIQTPHKKSGGNPIGFPPESLI